MTVRVLLVESDTEEVLFLRDVLEEMESSEFWSGWLHLDVVDAPTWAFSEALLAAEPVDVVLLDLNLDDVSGPEAFRKAQAIAPQIPVVLLAEDKDLDLAARLVREGAQDFLLKKYIDCEPLAHAVRNAIERHRLLSAARAAAMTDALTGLLNRSAFQLLADRDRRLAERTGRRLGIVVLEPIDLDAARTGQNRDLALVEAADRLRSLSSPTDLVARIAENRFAVGLFETDAESLESAIDRYRRAGSAIMNPNQPVSLDALLEQAEQNLSSTAVAAAG